MFRQLGRGAALVFGEEGYDETSRPAYCARYRFVDEIVNLSALRGYLKAFAGAVYQNPRSICPRHQMLLPRIIKG